MARRFALLAIALYLIVVSTWDTRPVVFAQEGADPGSGVYARNCAACHDKTVPRMPSRSVLQQRSAIFILKALNSGVMKEQGAALSLAERTQVAQWLGRKTALGVDKATLANPCQGGPTSVPGSPTWTSWGGGLENHRFQPPAAARLSPEQAGRLKLKWAFGVPDLTSLRSQPAVYGGSVLFGGGTVLYAVHAATGCTRWATELPAAVRTGISIGSPGDKPLAFFGDGAANVYAVEVGTGTPAWQVRVDSHPAAMVTGTPVYHDGRLYVPVSSQEEVTALKPGYVCCTFRGSIVALDAASGKTVWRTYTINRPANEASVNKLGNPSTGPSGAAIWSVTGERWEASNGARQRMASESTPRQMKSLLGIAICFVFLLPASAFAHRLDEYLEATLLSLGSGRVDGTIRLVPGVAVSSTVISGIHTNGDGTLSEAEQMAYASRVLQDLSLSVDGWSLPLHLVSVSFPSIDEMKQGIGEIQIGFTANLPAGAGQRKLIFENHHRNGIAVYLVNCLVPQDKNIQLRAQNRNENQSYYQLDFMQGGAVAEHGIVLSFSGFAGSFHLGLRHIAEGTDHLLFLLTLLLPAPMLACGRRWSERASVQRSLLQILRILTAFTLGHSLTLALAAFGVMQLPTRPVEVLIAFSILVSAVHAIRPLFPGREAIIAAFFGLIHGLAFASALGNLGFGSWYRLVSVLGFNLGIEAMQLTVVAITLPSLLLLSRTRPYALLRKGGGCFAALAALGWLWERSFNTGNVVDRIVENVAHRSPWIAIVLFLLSFCCWQMRELARESGASA